MSPPLSPPRDQDMDEEDPFGLEQFFADLRKKSGIFPDSTHFYPVQCKFLPNYIRIDLYMILIENWEDAYFGIDQVSGR